MSRNPFAKMRPRGRSRWSYVPAWLTASVITLTVGGVGPAISPAQSVAEAVVPADDFAAASAEAAESGQAVEVASQTSETSIVMANPDGSFGLTSSLTPVRAEVDGEWAPVDSNLRYNDDGTLSPTVSTLDVTFSGGGLQPAVTVRSGDAAISFSWPTALPSPIISGDSALYPAVLPGVDLQLTARADSYGETLIVHDAQAAANLAATDLQFSTSVQGLDLAVTDGGELSATDSSGAEIFHGSQPVMWDSDAGLHVADAPSADDPAGATTTPVDLQMPTAEAADGDEQATSVLTLEPPVQELTGSDVVYPVYIDPPLNKGRADFAVTTTANGNWHYYDDTTYDLKMGYCPQDQTPEACQGYWKARTYLAFDTSALSGKATTAVVYDAEVDLYEQHAAYCGAATPIDLYTSTNISTSTTWPGPIGTFLQEKNSKLGDECDDSAGDVVFDGSAVVDRFQSAANNGWDTLNFAVRAQDETDWHQWKRFASSSSGAAAASIHVHFNFPPSKPTGLKVGSLVACAGKPRLTSFPTPTLQASATSYTGGQVGLKFRLYTAGGSLRRYNPLPIAKTSGDPGNWATGGATNVYDATDHQNNDPLPDGAYKFSATAVSLSSDTPDTAGTTSTYYSFTVDHTAPGTPQISSFKFPENTWGATASNGSFTFSTAGDVAGFAYGYDHSAFGFVPDDGECQYTSSPNASGGRVAADNNGSARVNTPDNLTPGYHTLSVVAFDDAHNPSAATQDYVFYVSPEYGSENYGKREGENYDFIADPDAPAGADTYVEGPNDRWSGITTAGGFDRRFVANAPACFTTSFTTAIQADYAVGAQLATYYHYGTVFFKLDGTPLQINGANVSVTLTGSSTIGTTYSILGGEHLLSGAHTFSLCITSGATGPNSSVTYDGTVGNDGSPDTTFPHARATFHQYADNGFSAGLDYFRVVPINNATFDSLESAENNDGIGSFANHVSANIGPGISRTALDEGALSGKDLVPNSDFTVNAPAGTGQGATTTFHVGSFAGKDNVVAMGQTITLPSDVIAPWVDLLVTTTCGSTPWLQSVQASIHFTGASKKDVQLPIVPRMNTSTVGPIQPNQDARISKVLTVSSLLRDVDRDGTPERDTTVTGSLFVVSLPTDGAGDGPHPIHSITLPYLGSDLTESCDKPNLHVFSISTH